MMLTGTKPGRGGPGACGRGTASACVCSLHHRPPVPPPQALSTHQPAGNVVCLHGLHRAEEEEGPRLGGAGGSRTGTGRAQGGYSQIPGPGVKVSKQPPPTHTPSRPLQLNGASVWRQRALQRPARAGSPRTGSLEGGRDGGPGAWVHERAVDMRACNLGSLMGEGA